jgi:tRNA A37 threonylcarbamoyltransferase TsaD
LPNFAKRVALNILWVLVCHTHLKANECSGIHHNRVKMPTLAIVVSGQSEPRG